MIHHTCLVTGASSGIGLETARGLAALGADVLLLGRDAERLAAARRDIARTVPGARLSIVVADLGSQVQIREVSRAIRQAHRRLDVLIHNAGAIERHRQLTADGIERQWAVNHLAAFLLTHLLRDLLAAAPRARIVTVASAVEVMGRLDPEPEDGEPYDPAAVYCRCKLANVMFTYALARRVPATMTANCLHPGVVRTRLLAEYFGGTGPVSWLKQARYPGPEAGARQVIFVASAAELEGVSGQYFVDGHRAKTSAVSLDVARQERLWIESERQTRLAPDERFPVA